MNHFVHRMLGHYLQDEAEEGNDLGGQSDAVDEGQDQGEDEQGSEESELVISLGESPEEGEQEPDDNAAPQYVRDMRKRIRDQNKELKELRTKAEQRAQAERPKAPEVGPKPTLEDCDYDADDFEQKLTAWHDKKREADAFAADQQKAAQKQEEEWQAKRDNYAAQRQQINLSDYEDVEAAASEALNQNQQAIIISGADKPAHLIYAIGKNPAKLKELAGITDPIKFAFAVAKLETQMKVESKTKAKPAPERVVTGSAPSTGGSDATLERLRADAEKTGDYSKVSAYKKQLREKARA